MECRRLCTLSGGALVCMLVNREGESAGCLSLCESAVLLSRSGWGSRKGCQRLLFVVTASSAYQWVGRGSAREGLLRTYGRSTFSDRGARIGGVGSSLTPAVALLVCMPARRECMRAEYFFLLRFRRLRFDDCLWVEGGACRLLSTLSGGTFGKHFSGSGERARGTFVLIPPAF